jgi:hypothetical protein
MEQFVDSTRFLSFRLYYYLLALFVILIIEPSMDLSCFFIPCTMITSSKLRFLFGGSHVSQVPSDLSIGTPTAGFQVHDQRIFIFPTSGASCSRCIPFSISSLGASLGARSLPLVVYTLIATPQHRRFCVCISL